jgi:histidinol dehydrogenase
MLSRIDLRDYTGDFVAPLTRATNEPASENGPLTAVRAILLAVRERGDAAVREYTERFDGCTIEQFRVPPADLSFALASVAPDVREALEMARDRITGYHEAQVGTPATFDRDGISIRDMVVPVDRAGLYVPGGRAAYPSTVLMTAIPAHVAGVSSIALCVPPDRGGRVPATTLAAAALLGLDEVYAIGGAQAIGALAYGTETIRPVDVIVGPGNLYVALAKREVSGVVGIDSLAGPSEVAIIADDSARADYVAADLIAQAEHGPGGAAILVTWSEGLADAVDAVLDTMVGAATRKIEIDATLDSGGTCILVRGPVEAIEAVNAIAPEHLQIMTTDPEALVPMVRNAGAIFCGALAPAAFGDYIAGVNHVLPTGRTARFASALRVDTFRKHIHVVDVDAEGLATLGPMVEVFATSEGLDAHAASVAIRRTAP